MSRSPALLAIFLLAIEGAAACAGEADVVDASVRQTAGNTYSFSVTVRHADTGWEHYADRWQVLAPDGTVLGERVLLHPHETEQPFTRQLDGVVIPPEIGEVIIRASDSVHGFGGTELRLELPGDEG
jgi:hypothetical protein